MKEKKMEQDIDPFWEDSNVPLIKSYRELAMEYEKSLTELTNDLKLFRQDNSKIFIALDFCDIFEYCFPIGEILKGNFSGIYRDEKKKFFKRQLGRVGLFYFLTDLYSGSIILLPPYLAESIDSINILSKYGRNDLQIVDAEKNVRAYLQDVLNEFKNVDLCSLSQDNLYILLEKINKVSPDLAYIFSPSFISELDGFCDLLQNHLSPFNEEIEDYLILLDRIHEEDSTQIRKSIDHFRPKKYLPNKRDARAIKYLEEINKHIGKNQILILISSAEVFNKFRKNIKCNKEYIINKEVYPPIFCEKSINNKRYKLLRNIDPYYLALLEICNLAAEKKICLDEFDISKLNKTEFLNKLERDKNQIRSFLNLTDDTRFILSGNLRWDSLSDATNIFIQFIENIESKERNDLFVLIKKINLLKYGKNYLDKLDTDEIVVALEQIRTTIESEEIWDIFLKNKIEDITKRKIELKSLIDKFTKNLSISDNIGELIIADFGEKLEESLKNNDLRTLKSKIESKGMDFPEIPTVLKLSPNLWVLLDRESSNNLLYFIERDRKRFNLVVLDINIIYNKIKSMYERIRIDDTISEDVNSTPLLKIINNKINPIYNKINYGKKSKLKYYYNEIIRRISINDTD
jgi:hypothetical protein